MDSSHDRNLRELWQVMPEIASDIIGAQDINVK